MSDIVRPDYRRSRFEPPFKRRPPRSQASSFLIVCGLVAMIWALPYALERLGGMQDLFDGYSESAAGTAAVVPYRIEVIDGDTVRAGGEVYRLVGFNTPESGGNASCPEERALANRATLRLRRLLASGEATLTRVACACRPGTEGTRACNFGRLCGALSVGGEDAGAILIAEGLAEPYICRGTSCPKRKDWCAG